MPEPSVLWGLPRTRVFVGVYGMYGGQSMGQSKGNTLSINGSYLLLPSLKLSPFDQAKGVTFSGHPDATDPVRIGVLDQNPLGSAAGFGINGLALDRAETAKLLGFQMLGEKSDRVNDPWMFWHI